MKIATILVVIAIGALAGAAGSWVVTPHVAVVAPAATQPTAAKESVYDRVMRTGTLRCGYLLWSPFIMKDPNSGQFTGPWYDVIEEMGKRLGLKIEWTEEVGTATMFEGFKTGRYDALCGPITSTAERARVVDFTVPFVYSPYTLYVRKDDTRFDANPLAAANTPETRVVTIDGEYSAKMAADDLPKATAISLQNMTQGSELLLYVESGKADVAPDDGVSAGDFIAAHNGSLKPVAGPPLRVLPIVLPIPKGEPELKQMLDVTLGEMLNTGFTQKIFDKSAGHPGLYLYPATVQPAR